MIFWMFLFLFPFLYLIPQTVLAARPLSTDDTATVEQGKFQLEGGMGGIRVDSENREFTSSAVLTYGLLDRLDFRCRNRLSPLSGLVLKSTRRAPPYLVNSFS